MKNMTKDEKLTELIQRVVARLKIQAPPAEISDASAIAAYYDIFNNPPRWKPGIRTPQENAVSSGKPNLSFKRRAPLVVA